MKKIIEKNRRGIKMKEHNYAVIYKDTGEIHQTFEYWGEALYCITDSFGPEYYTVEAITLSDKDSKEN